MRTPENKGPNVALGYLDELVQEYIDALPRPGAGSWPWCAQGSPAADTWEVRSLIETGRIGEAVDLMQRACPAVLEDPRLVFRLERQAFVELLRQGTVDGDARALECAQQRLAPLALHAYPEAFTDFKTAMLLLLKRARPGGGNGDGDGGGESGSSSDEGEDDGDGEGDGGSGGRAALVMTSDGQLHRCSDDAHAHCAVRPGVRIECCAIPSNSGGGGGGNGGRARRSGGGPGGGGGGGGGGRGMREGARAVWSQAARRELAEAVFHAMRGRLGWREPRLALLARYLLLLWAKHTASGAGGGAGAGALSGLHLDAARALLRYDGAGGGRGHAPPPPREAPPLPSEAVGMSFAEADVLDLMQAAWAPRGAALDALKRARGDVQAALLDELHRVRFDHRALAVLARQHLFCRGLPARLPGAGGAGGMDVDGEGGGSDEEELAAAAEDEGAKAPAADEGRQGRPARPPSEAAAAAAASGGEPGQQQQQQQQWARGQSRSPPCKVQRRGANQSPTGTSDDSGGNAAAPLATAAKRAAAAAAAAAASPAAAARERRAALSELQALTRAGKWDDALALLEARAPGALAAAPPEVALSLHRARFAARAAAGDAAGALALARAEMAPLADAHPSLLPALKAAVSALLPGGGGRGPGTSVGSGSGAAQAREDAALAALLHDVLAGALGVQTSDLAALLQGLLAAHRQWFRAQRCSDPFAAALGVKQLSAPDGGGAAAAGAPAATAAAAAAAAPGTFPRAGARAAPRSGGGGGDLSMGEAGAGGSDGDGYHDSEEDDDHGSDDDDDPEGSGGGGGGPVDEAAVLRLMEILEVPRGLAIELLAQHHGSVEDAVMQVVAG